MRRNSAKIGAELPKGFKPDGLPSEFTQQISALAVIPLSGIGFWLFIIEPRRKIYD